MHNSHPLEIECSVQVVEHQQPSQEKENKNRIVIFYCLCETINRPSTKYLQQKDQLLILVSLTAFSKFLLKIYSCVKG